MLIPTLPKYTVGSVPGHCLHVRVVVFCLFVFCVCFCCCFFRVFFSFAKRPDRRRDLSIYLSFEFYFNVIASKSHTKTIQKMGERNEKENFTTANK